MATAALNPPSLDLNCRGGQIAAALIADAAAAGVGVHQVAGATVVDAGVEVRGSLRAGLALARVCLAGLADVQLVPGQVGAVPMPRVSVAVDQPVLACMASQYAGWQISVGKFFAMGSGPMRAAYGKEDLFDHIGGRESATKVVGVLETSKLPDEGVIAYLAERCRVSASELMLLCARTASLAGGVQVVARSVETALHKLHSLAFDLGRIVGGFGSAPLPPVARDDMAAIGRTNDAVLYGGEVTLYATGDDASLAAVTAKLPSAASRDHGKPFAEIFAAYKYDFYKIDPMLFSPAVVAVQNVETGVTHRAGQIEPAVLERSFFG